MKGQKGAVVVVVVVDTEMELRGNGRYHPGRYETNYKSLQNNIYSWW